MPEILLKTFDFILDLFFPRSALVLELESMSQSVALSKLSAPEEKPPVGATSLFSYKNRMVRELIWQIKYKNNQILIAGCAKLLYEVILEDLSEKNFFENSIPVLIPIPMSHIKRKEKGFNQAESLCKEIIKLDSQNLFHYEPSVLLKALETVSQTKTKNRQERLNNLKGSFGISDPEKISGRNIILIDDVVTTGATIAEAKKVLKGALVKDVCIYSIAH